MIKTMNWTLPLVCTVIQLADTFRIPRKGIVGYGVPAALVHLDVQPVAGKIRLIGTDYMLI